LRREGVSRKLDLLESRPDDIDLAQDLLDRMAHNGADFTLVFRRLCDAAGPQGDAGVRTLFADPGDFDNSANGITSKQSMAWRSQAEQSTAKQEPDAAKHWSEALSPAMATFQSVSGGIGCSQKDVLRAMVGLGQSGPGSTLPCKDIIRRNSGASRDRRRGRSRKPR
jgi:uncharacterized protein YdiU (UPF0061 family)